MKELKDNDFVLNKLVLKIEPKYYHSKFLSTFTKDELNKIRKELSLKGASNLSKTELVECISKKIKDEIDVILQQLTYREFCYLKKLYKNKGYLKVKNSDIKILYRLRNQGIAFCIAESEHKIAVIPEDLIELLKKSMEDKYFEEYLHYRDKISNVLVGILNFYGVMRYNVIHDVLTKITAQYFDDEYIKEIINIAKKTELIEYNEDIVYLNKVNEPYKILKEQDGLNQIRFINLTVQDALSAFERRNKLNKYEEKLYNHIITSYGIANDTAGDIVNKCTFMIKNEVHINEVISAIKHQLSSSDAIVDKELISLIDDINENTIRWTFKGYSINDIKRIYINLSNGTQTNLNISRNDLCPCGSGKKYKKCCGR